VGAGAASFDSFSIVLLVVWARPPRSPAFVSMMANCEEEFYSLDWLVTGIRSGLSCVMRGVRRDAVLFGLDEQ